MNEIKCPHCGKTITIDESSYKSLAEQVRDHEFAQELEKRTKELEAQSKDKMDLEVRKALEEYQTKLMNKDQEILSLKTTLTESKAKLSSIQDVQTHELESMEAKHRLELQTMESQLNDAHQKEVFDLTEQVSYYRDLKAKSSTKMVGESLEQHCMDEFDKLRATAFANDYFEKDNEISETGSKGDFIYRAYDSDGTELVSIMFEMKNEMETTQEKQKHKNSDFFKELDKDRREKNCEYAVLCSLLEADSNLYNQGIVDVSHRYPKMYVIRPQFFIVIITLLRNAARTQIDLRHQLAAAQQSNVDILEFEKQVDLFKNAFGKNYDLASRRFEETLAEIDKAILHLQKTKEALTSCDRNLRLANDKTESLSVQKLLKNSPSLLAQID